MKTGILALAIVAPTVAGALAIGFLGLVLVWSPEAVAELAGKLSNSLSQLFGDNKAA